MSRKSKALEFAQEGYNITITGRHIQVTDSMKSYAMEKISKIERFTSRLIDVNVTMDIQKLDHRVDIVLKSGNLKIKGSASDIDMYASIDRAVKRIEEQLRRYKNKLDDHHARGLTTVDMNVNVIRAPSEQEIIEVNEDIEDENWRQLEENYRPHAVVSKEKRPLRILSLEEAVMKMELSQDAFLIFLHEVDRKLKIIYRRNDGNYGVIEPQP